jgi:outer membrane protein OmpA-like peptidoglycan-associated protein
MKTILLLIASLLAVKGYGQSHDTFQVHFALNDTKIGKRASDFIDHLIFKDVLIHGQKLIVLGYADYLGSNAHNDSLSAARAKSVKDYLVDAGFDTKDITLCMGKGKIEREPVGKDGYAHDRKVQIIIDHSTPVVVAPTKPPVHKETKVAAAPKPPPVKETKVMDIAEVKVNQTIALKNICFEGGTPNILPESIPELNNLLEVLQKNDKINIQIEGHICCAGPIEGTDLNDLSVFRAMAVYDYLVKNGIEKDRLKFVGLGNRNPVANPEVTEEDRVKNRRVEIRILSK